MNKTKTELNKMTKKNLLLHIEDLQSRPGRPIISQDKPDLTNMRRRAGQMRRNIFKMKLNPKDRKRIIDEIDSFMDKLS